KASDPSMKGTLNTWGLEKLTDAYGIEMKKDALFDWGLGMRLPAQTQAGQVKWYGMRALIQAQTDTRLDDKNTQIIDTSFIPFFRLDELAFPFPSTLIPHPDKETQARLHVVARTSPRALSE